MQLHIDSSKKIADIQSEFCKRFPFLKIKFFSSAHEVGKLNSSNEEIDGERTLLEVRTRGQEGSLIVTSLMKVFELESAFQDLFGLGVQVLRKSGDIWLQTSKTDSLTLGEQNQIAREREMPIGSSEIEEDYREQE